VGAGARQVAHRLRRRRRHRWPARPGRGPHQCCDHRLAERSVSVVAGRDHPRDHRPIGVLRQGRTRGPARRCADRRPVPPCSSCERHAHPGPPTGHPRNRGQARPQDRPGLGSPSPAADRTRAPPARNLCEDVELADRHRRRRGSHSSGLYRQGGATQPAQLGRHEPRTPHHPDPVGQLLPAGRRDRRTRGTPPRSHCRGVVAGHRGRPSDGAFERSGFTLHLVLLFRVVVWHVSAVRAHLLDAATGV
jgi:hypothetical protein